MKTSVAKKFWMALTGFFLIVFLLVHLAINLLTLSSNPDYFNAASEFMATNPLIKVMQYVLALGFILHIGTGIVLTSKNRAARPIKYLHAHPGENSSFASRNMIITGVLVLLFLVLHLKDFFYVMKFGDMEEMTDYELVTSLFSVWYYTALYVVSFILLAVHLGHGFHSAFQSMGWNHPKYTPFVKKLSVLYCFIIGAGFTAVALINFALSLS